MTESPSGTVASLFTDLEVSPRLWDLASDVVAVVLVLFVLAPMLVVVVARFGHSYTPASDVGSIDLRVREVWSLHPPLVGPYGNRGWDHPGPLLFYLLAVPSLLAGRAAWATQVGGALLQAVAIVWLARLAWRRGRLPLLAVTMLGVALVEHNLSPLVVRDPWNPHVALPFFLLFLFQAWLLATGDARVLPGATAVATFLVQTHIGYAPLVLMAAVVVVIYRVVDTRTRSSSALPSSSSPSSSAWSWARATRWSEVILVVLWIPPLLDAILHWPGNLGAIGKYFAHPGQSAMPQLGLRAGGRLLAAEFRPIPDWLGGVSDFNWVAHATGASLAWLVVPAVLVGTALVVTHRRAAAATSRYLVLVSALALGGWFACSRLEGPPIAYLILWRPVLAIAIVLGVGWAFIDGSRLTRPPVTMLGLAAVTITVALLATSFAVRVADVTGDTAVERETASLARQLERHGIPEGGVILRLEWDSLLQLQRGLYDELDRRGAPVFVDISQDYQYRRGRAVPAEAVSKVWWVAESGAALAALGAQPGAKVIATWSPLKPAKDRRVRQLAAELYAEFEAAGRPELVRYLDSPFLTLATDDVPGVDHGAARELLALNREVADHGASRGGVVEFAPDEAPDFVPGIATGPAPRQPG